jgi:glucoamylase
MRLLAPIRRPIGITVAAAIAIASLTAVVPSAAADQTYDGQPLHDAALFNIKASNNAAAQEFVTAETHIDEVSLYLSSAASTGTISVEIRTAPTDPNSAIATSSLDIAQIGGGGAGWLDFPLDADVQPGTTYYLYAQATTSESGLIAWYGTPQAVEGALTSWNYDLPYWGGWEPYTSHLAFFVNPTGSEGCGNIDDCYRGVPPSVLAAYTAGLFNNESTTAAITPLQAYGSTYVPDSNVLQLPSGNWRYLPDGATEPVTVPADDPSALAQIAEARQWLASGTVPGRTADERAAAKRALLSMRALLQPNGAFAAAWYSIWKYSWPRDSSFVAAAFAHTGHTDEAYQIISYNAQTQRADGTWEARTTLDGSGPPDGRHWQLDANGWVPWSAWQWYQEAPRRDRTKQLIVLYPRIEKAANYAANSLDHSGLPPASPDYWELGTDTANIGTAAPLLAGLNAAADLAHQLGHRDDRDRWSTAARRLAAAIAEHFAPIGYPRTADGLHGRDSAAAFMAPPFNQAPRDLAPALDTTYQALLRPNGGVVPGDDPDQNWGTNTWTPSTSFFALAWSGIGEKQKADMVLDWVLSKRNMLGELPEMVNSDGHPMSTVPLGWTGSIVLMTLIQLDGNPLPVPPLRQWR